MEDKCPKRAKRDFHGDKHPRWNGGRIVHCKGYIHVWTPDRGYVFEHVLKCEKALGKPIPAGAEPHHVDGNKGNNENANLVLCQDRAYHQLIELRTRAYRACGHADWLKCWVCQKWDDPVNMFVRKNRPAAHHRECFNKRERDRYVRKSM